MIEFVCFTYISCVSAGCKERDKRNDAEEVTSVERKLRQSSPGGGGTQTPKSRNVVFPANYVSL